MAVVEENMVWVEVGVDVKTSVLEGGRWERKKEEVRISLLAQSGAVHGQSQNSVWGRCHHHTECWRLEGVLCTMRIKR